MVAAGLPVALDSRPNKPSRKGEPLTFTIEIRTSEDWQQAAVSAALALGLVEATRWVIARIEGLAGSAPAAQSLTPSRIASALMQDLVAHPDFYQAFREYYGGLRWGSDQERFVRALFEYGASFDPDLLATALQGVHLAHVARQLDLDLSSRFDWYRVPVTTLLEAVPEIDYRRLADDDFRATAEGRRLLGAYADVCGEILSARWRASHPSLTAEGIELPQPMIPLARQPLTEAIMVQEVLVDRPRAKYDFGASEIVGIIADSDSAMAHDALVTGINTRIPQGQRWVIDGEKEFGQKGRAIGTLLHEYRAAQSNPEHRALLLQDLLSVLAAYTGHTPLAESVRAEARDAEAHDTWSSDAGDVREIITTILTRAVAAPDADLVAAAGALITGPAVTAANQRGPKGDPLLLSNAESALVVIDALDNINRFSDVAAFERMASQAFGGAERGRAFAQIAATRQHADSMANAPAARQAYGAWRRRPTRDAKDKTAEDVAIERAYYEAMQPSWNLVEDAAVAKRDLLLALLQEFAESPALRDPQSTASRLFNPITKRVSLGHCEDGHLPATYATLMQLAQDPRVLPDMRNTILWHIAESWSYLRENALGVLSGVVLDMYRVVLGPPGAVPRPDGSAWLGLAAASHLVSERGRQFFALAPPSMLRTLADYGAAVRAEIQRLDEEEAGEPPKRSRRGGETSESALRKRLGDVVRELEKIEEVYRRFLRMEAVKVSPIEYYTWVIDALVPFWQRLEWDVNPDNEPRPAIRALHDAIGRCIDRLDIRKREAYPAEFDVVRDGHLDQLLATCYDLMVPETDLHYSTSVWQYGLPFITEAARLMPTRLRDRLSERYAGSAFGDFVEHYRGPESEPPPPTSLLLT